MKQAAVHRVAVIEFGVFAVVCACFGIHAFVTIQGWGVQYDKKLAAIQRGEVKPEMLRLLRIEDAGRHGTSAILSEEDGGKPVAHRKVRDVSAIWVGQRFKGYRFGDRFLIPHFDTGGHHWGKWFFLSIGLLPGAIIAVIALLRWRGRTSSR
jgi:hypothetical protein